ncbi:MAG TPA: multiheme c-type cytochrome [Fimbriiglobus sp.]|nr:multiheme c-type cytochrome [Fimbriiglobus sp.]
MNGCAARGCHGGPTIGPDGQSRAVNSGNAFTHWLLHDRHARAYHALTTEKSSEIIRRLGKGWRAATEEPRCLACHTTPALATPPPASDEVRRLRFEGVSCDACHTRPRHGTGEWLTRHTKGWADGGLPDCYQNRGMRWFGDATARAATCVGCHVGAPARSGLPARDVTHDLIAAGHPRLNFEYLTYLSALPPHWIEHGPRPAPAPPSQAPVSPGYEAHAWLAGQIETARAGLELCAARAKNWPELAEFDCYSCHHDLKPAGRASWRALRAAARSPGAPGRLPWAGANVSDPLLKFLTPVFADRFAAAGRDATSWHPPDVKEFAELLPRPGAVPTLDAADPQAGLKLFQELRLRERAAAGELWRMSWDEAAQTYYALRAADASRRRAGPPDAPDEGIAASLERVRKVVVLPQHPRVNSPATYDPNATAKAIGEVIAAFEQWSAKHTQR